jgi:CheY-like chemotaxis protein
LGEETRGDSLPAALPVRESSPPGAPQRSKILMADDDPFIRTVLRKGLREEFEVVIAEDGLDALTLILRERPDVILLDVRLPKINGFEVCRALRACAFDQPILFLSALSDPTERTRGLSLGATDFIAKPFQIREVIERIRATSRRPRSGTWGSAETTDLGALLRAARSRAIPPEAFRARLSEACRDVVRFGASLGIVRFRWSTASSPESIDRLHRELERLTRAEDLLTFDAREEAIVVLHTEGRAGTIGFVRRIRREWESGASAPRPAALPGNIHVGIGVVLPARDGRTPVAASALEATEASDDLFENPLYAADRPFAGTLERPLASGTAGA